MKKNYSIRESVFIKDSLNNSFMLFRDNNENLLFDKINIDNSSMIIDKDIMDFSATIDENNRLHLLYLNKSGELIYCTYSENAWHKNLIGRLDIQSNMYKYLTLLIHKNTINIFYATANIINLNLWTIEHIVKNIDNWQKHVVTNIFSDKTLDPFYIDQDEFGNIYLVYSGKESVHYNVYYLFFNTFNKKWAPNPTKISSSFVDNILPYIFVDTQNNVHILWYCSNNGEYLLKYKRFSSIGEDKFHWREIKLPKITGSNSHALMLEKYNRLNILYAERNEIYNLVSNDHGNSWILEDKTSIVNHPLYLVQYYNLSLNRLRHKINHYYGSIDKASISFYCDDFHEDLKEFNEFKAASLKGEKDSVKDDIKDNINLEEKENKAKSQAPKDELEKLKKDLVEIKDQVKLIKKDIKLIKDKLQNIEERTKNRMGFLKIKK